MSKHSSSISPEDFTIHHNGKKGEYFFSTGHCQDHGLEGFVPSSGGLPMRVAQREAVPDGVIRTIDEYIAVFHRGETEIPNPDRSFQPNPV